MICSWHVASFQNLITDGRLRGEADMELIDTGNHHDVDNPERLRRNMPQ
jgi:hypothetical protein